MLHLKCHKGGARVFIEEVAKLGQLKAMTMNRLNIRGRRWINLGFCPAGGHDWCQRHVVIHQGHHEPDKAGVGGRRGGQGNYRG